MDPTYTLKPQLRIKITNIYIYILVIVNCQIVHLVKFSVGEDALNPPTSPWLQYYYLS